MAKSITEPWMNKKTLSERDICTKFITPALEEAGWDKQSHLHEAVPLMAGRVVVRGNQANRDKTSLRRDDFILFYNPGMPLAAVENKDNQRGFTTWRTAGTSRLQPIVAELNQKQRDELERSS